MSITRTLAQLHAKRGDEVAIHLGADVDGKAQLVAEANSKHPIKMGVASEIGMNYSSGIQLDYLLLAAS